MRVGVAGKPAGGFGSAHEAADARLRLFGSVAGLFTQLAGDTPLLIILDNLHRADSASVQLLDFVAQQCAAERVLLLGAYRNGETAGALLGLGGQMLPLAGLSSARLLDFPEGVEQRYQSAWRDYVYHAATDGAIAHFRALTNAGILFHVETLVAQNHDTSRVLATNVVPAIGIAGSQRG